jgi:hypothetical protein
MEASASLMKVDEEVAGHGSPYFGDPGRRRGGSAGGAGLSQARNQYGDVIPVEKQIRGYVGWLAQAGEGARCGEKQAQEAVRRARTAERRR